MPDVATPLLNCDVADLRALAEKDLGRSAAVAGLVVVLGDVLVEVVKFRVLAGDDQRVGEDARASFVREVLADDGLVDDDSIRDVEKRSTGEEGRMECGETVAVGVHKGEQPRLDQVGVFLRGLAEWLEGHALGQRRRPEEPFAVAGLGLGELALVETAGVGPPALLPGRSGRPQAAVAVPAPSADGAAAGPP